MRENPLASEEAIDILGFLRRSLGLVCSIESEYKGKIRRRREGGRVRETDGKKKNERW